MKRLGIFLLVSSFFLPLHSVSAVDTCILNVPSSLQKGQLFSVTVEGNDYGAGTEATLFISMPPGNTPPSITDTANYTNKKAFFSVDGSSVTEVGLVSFHASIFRGAGAGTEFSACDKNSTIVAAPPPPPAPPPAPAPAPGTCPPGTPPGSVCIPNPLRAATIVDLLNNIINFIFNLAIIITPLMVVIGGFLFVTGGSDPAKLKQGKDILLWTAIGFGVILLAKGLVQVLLSILTI